MIWDANLHKDLKKLKELIKATSIPKISDSKNKSDAQMPPKRVLVQSCKNSDQNQKPMAYSSKTAKPGSQYTRIQNETLTLAYRYKKNHAFIFMKGWHLLKSTTNHIFSLFLMF